MLLKFFAKFTEKATVSESLFNKFAGLRHANLRKKGLRRRCFPVFFVFSYYPSWSIFNSKLKWLNASQSPYFATNVVKRNDNLAYQLPFVSPCLKLLYICSKAVWFWEQSNLLRKIHLLYWKYSLLHSWDKFETNILRICAYLSLTHEPLHTVHRLFLALKSVVASSNWSSFPAKTRRPPCSSFWVYSKN